MSGIITTGNHPKALWPGIKVWWGRKYNEHSVEYTGLFDVDSSSEKNYEELVEATGFGLAPVKDQGASVQYDSEQQGTVTKSIHVAYALGYIVTREERDDNLYTIISKQRSGALAFSMRQTKEIVGANVYNRAFSDSYTFGDGKELLATDHPTLDGTQSNELAVAADLSEAALEDLTIQIMNAKNSRGLRINLMPRKLIVPPSLYYEAHRILDSNMRVDTANNDTNVIRDQSIFPEGIMVNHYLTDADAFFIRTNVPAAGLTCFDRVPIEFGQDNEFDTDNAKAKCYERYSFNVGDFRALYGSQGA